jgi:hypothetical protein
LVEHILRVTGKDVSRISLILQQGVVVSGASRLRWTPIDAAPDEIASVLEAFPDSLPGRPFDPSRCIRVALVGGRSTIDLSRDVASQKRFLQRRSFWHALTEIAAGLTLTYQHYSYADRADLYRADLSLDAARSLREHAGLLRYSSLEMQVRDYAYDRIELWVER